MAYLLNLIGSVLSALLLFSTTGQAAHAPPDVWFSPAVESADYLDLFVKPELWASVRGRISVFKFSPAQVRRPKPGDVNTVDDLKRVDAFRKLQRWGISVALEVPSVKEWDCSAQGDTRDTRVHGNAAATTMNFIKNVYDGGGAVQFLAMDEPLVSGLVACHETIEVVAARTASYARSILTNKDVNTWTKSLSIGDIEAYPSRTVEQIEAWIMALMSKGFKPSFFHLDVDPNDVAARGGKLDSARDYKNLQAFFHAQGIPFGIIFWSGHNPEMSDQSYFSHTLSWVGDVHSAIGAPDQLIFQSWVRRLDASCSASFGCARDMNPACRPIEPASCGRSSVPINLPEDNPSIFSHMRLVNESFNKLSARRSR